MRSIQHAASRSRVRSGAGSAVTSRRGYLIMTRIRTGAMTRGVVLLLVAVFLAAAAGLSISPASAGTAVPTVRTLDSLKNQYQPVKFDHAKHATMAPNCGSCHHEHGEGNAFSCKNCHALDRSAFRNAVVNSFTACKNCHGTYDPSNPRMPGLKTAYHTQCFSCHRGMAGIGTDPKGCAELCHARRTDALTLR